MPIGNSPERRGVAAKASKVWTGDWTTTGQATLDPKDVFGPGPHKPDFYIPGVVPYFGQYVGLPSTYYHPADQPDGPVYPTFMYSRNGKTWSFPSPYQPIIDLGAHGRNRQNFGQAYLGTPSLLDHEGWLYLYYVYMPWQHNSDNDASGEYHLTRLREDRFVGIGSVSGQVGTWTTSEIVLTDDPGQLILNAVVRGSLRVELLDAATVQPLPGYAAADAVPKTPGDYLHAVGCWNGGKNLSALAGKTIRLRFA